MGFDDEFLNLHSSLSPKQGLCSKLDCLYCTSIVYINCSIFSAGSKFGSQPRSIIVITCIALPPNRGREYQWLRVVFILSQRDVKRYDATTCADAVASRVYARVDKGARRIERYEVVRQQLGKRSARVVDKGAFAESDDVQVSATCVPVDRVIGKRAEEM
ncbi:hypothetical protein G5I_03519 [Acromyrmex echinatior]|uniref:Uncharacterized protein n=1 Tax=Acromyrmex echinatior TaxID=103372 RepID=F4WD69_ACREC|nr:hypothetical protein G5I_03519 [Acromyrmex echinatior]